MPRAAQAAEAEAFEWFLGGTGNITAQPVNSLGSGFEVQVRKVYDTSPWTWATLTLSWDANGTSYAVGNGPGEAGVSGNFGHDTPGTYTLSFKADYSQLSPPDNVAEINLTNSITLVAVTNITASTNHIALGTNKVTLTAQTTAAIGEEHVTWFAVGGSLSAYSGQTVEFVPYMHGPATVVASCGSSSAGTTLYVYAITGVSASPNPVAIGDTNLVLTATVEPAGCPLPIHWKFGGDDIGATTPVVTGTAQVTGKHEVKAALGSTAAWTDVWVVGVKELKYKNPLSGGYEDASGASYELKGTVMDFIALIDPPDAPGWPSGWPTWEGTGATVTGTGPAVSVTFSDVSSTMSDAKTVRAKCGTSEKSATTTVFKMKLTSIPAETWSGRASNPDQFGLGEVVVISNSVTPVGLTAEAAGVVYTPASNGYAGSGLLAGWDGMLGTLSKVSEPEAMSFELLKRGSLITWKNVEFIAPTEVIYQPLSTNLLQDVGDDEPLIVLPGPTKTANSWDIGKRYHVFIKPAHVSFTAMEFAEAEVNLTSDGLIDLGGVWPEWGYNSIGLPIAFIGGPVGLRLIIFHPNLSPLASAEGFNQGWQSASVPLLCRIPTLDPLVFLTYPVGNATFEGAYQGFSPFSIYFKWGTDMVNGTYSAPLPAASSP